MFDENLMRLDCEGISEEIHFDDICEAVLDGTLLFIRLHSGGVYLLEHDRLEMFVSVKMAANALGRRYDRSTRRILQPW